jgi:hypothetical protein
VDVAAGGACIASEAFYQLDWTHPPAVSEEQAALELAIQRIGSCMQVSRFGLIARLFLRPGLGASVGGIFFACGSEPIELDSSWIRAEMPDSLRRVREVQNQRMHGLQIQMNIISQHTNGVFLSVNGMICSHCHATIQMALLAAGIRLEMI